jgi:hypothetical protein
MSARQPPCLISVIKLPPHSLVSSVSCKKDVRKVLGLRTQPPFKILLRSFDEWVWFRTLSGSCCFRLSPNMFHFRVKPIISFRGSVHRRLKNVVNGKYWFTNPTWLFYRVCLNQCEMNHRNVNLTTFQTRFIGHPNVLRENKAPRVTVTLQPSSHSSRLFPVPEIES